MGKKIDIGFLGESYVLYKLAQLNIKSTILPNFFEYDLITEENIKIEIKTSSIIKDKDKRKGNVNFREIWIFHNYKREVKYLKNGQFEHKAVKRDRICDFFIFLGLNENNQIESEYIVPKEKIGMIQCIKIPRNPQIKGFRLQEYKNQWDLIAKF